MKNRYGEEYSFAKINENTYKFIGKLNYYRTGGLPGDELIHENDLGFFDPSGGPFISKGFLIEGRAVTRIFTQEDGFYFEVE